LGAAPRSPFHSMQAATTTHLLYLHGFRSSPNSVKARLMARRVAERYPAVTWWCPQLPPSPREAMELVLRGIAGWPRESMAVVGSSLGGFYATHVAAVTDCRRVVLLNPAVNPARDLEKYIGEQGQWDDPGQRFHFQPAFIGELRALEVTALPSPGRCLVVAARGDEVLDWREMVARYPGSRIELLEGGDHALSDFERHHLDDVMTFLDLR
ncbi:MAG: esterase, partial [Variovorax sp.]|nr:esterase [Variovorax sp.]